MVPPCTHRRCRGGQKIPGRFELTVADLTHQIRLYSRDLDLSDTNVLHAQSVPSPVLVMTLLDNSLLVYTADSMLYHFVIIPTSDSIRIQLCGSISFRGLVTVPARVRALSWLIPEAQKRELSCNGRADIRPRRPHGRPHRRHYHLPRRWPSCPFASAQGELSQTLARN